MNTPPDISPDVHEAVARRIIRAWGFRWVPYTELAAAPLGTPDHDKLAKLDGIRRDAEDAALAAIRQLSPNPGPAELSRRAEITKAMDGSAMHDIGKPAHD